MGPQPAGGRADVHRSVAGHGRVSAKRRRPRLSPLLVGSHLFHACSDRPGVRRSMRRDPACRAARAALAHIELPRRPDGPRAILGRTGFRPGNGAVRMRPMAQSVGSCPTGGSDSVEKQNQVRGDTSSDLLQFDGASNETRTHDPRFTRAVLYQLSYAGGHMRRESRRRMIILR